MDLTSWIIIGIAAMLILIGLTVFILLVYSGLFHQIKFRTGPSQLPEIYLAYKYAVGAYKDCGHLFCEAGKLAPTEDLIGIYYDDPAEVGDSNCRYIVGVVLSRDGSSVDEQLKAVLEQQGFAFFTIPHSELAINSTFPYNTKLSMYIYIHRFYTAVEKYMTDRKLDVGCMIEVYDDRMITFSAPLEKFDEFVVPEATK